jgi:predicted nucleic acid-binding protein
MADLSVFELVETTAGHVGRARQVQRLLASRSTRGRKVPDLLIAAAAEQAGLTLLHYDNDFELIAKVTGQICHWIVPAGTID